MTLIPAAPQPVRGRTDAAPGPVDRADRRASGETPIVQREAFASSLATARADRATPLPARPARDLARDFARDARPATARGDDSAPARVQGGSQRDRVRDLMLSGAMKFAATKGAASAAPRTVTPQNAAAPTRPIATRAVPDVGAPDIAPTNAAPSDAVVKAPAPDAPSVEAAVTSPVTPQPAVDASVEPMPPEMTLAAPTDVVVRAMPEMVNLPAESGTEAEPSEPAAPTDVPSDLSSSHAATVAAMQLIATLPIPIPTLVTAPAPDAASAGGDAPVGTQASAVPVPAPLTPADDTALVEDHFDAPAMTAAGVTAAGVTEAAPTPADVVSPRVPAPGATSANTSETAAASAATAARAATAVAAAGRADVSALQSDLSRLDPEFRDRLEKVIDRMRQEFGHDVTVVETVRSQARQEALFAQGRTAPGPIVTWTKNSKHAKGLAADLMVDGQWNNPQGYAHLAEVAKQEGLRTLGARDPGHVELNGDAAVSGETLGTLLDDLRGDAGDAARQLRADVSGNGGAAQRSAMLARVAEVAQVARVATVASVAKVATVARPGVPAAASEGNSNFSPLAVSGAAPIANNSDTAAAMRVVTPTAAVNMADRISHLMDLQATQDAKPLNSVLLRMDNANGIEDQIRIDTRGTLVDARLGLGNAQQAAALTDRIGELRDALERRGLTADGVRVQASGATRISDTATFSRPSLQTIELAAMRAASDSQANGGARDQASREQQQREALSRDTARHTPRSSADDPRHRSRREQPEDRR